MAIGPMVIIIPIIPAAGQTTAIGKADITITGIMAAIIITGMAITTIMDFGPDC